MASTWSQGDWNLGSWNNSATGAVITGQQLNTSLSSITVGVEVRQGWGRNTWSSATWNRAPDSFIDITTAGELDLNLNLGFGWNREEWNTGAWGEGLGFVLTGNGNIFATSALTQLTSTANNIIITAGAPISISGEQLNISQGEETVTGIANITIAGEELVSATVNTFAVAAGGAITINTPTLEANTALNNDGIVVGLANFLDIVGMPLTSNLGTITTTTENIIPITGEELTSSANTITISAEQILSITGNELTISQATIIPNSNNFLPMTGNQVNVDVTTLKFWDPINDNNQENWTNIH